MQMEVDHSWHHILGAISQSLEEIPTITKHAHAYKRCANNASDAPCIFTTKQRQRAQYFYRPKIPIPMLVSFYHASERHTCVSFIRPPSFAGDAFPRGRFVWTKVQ